MANIFNFGAGPAKLPSEVYDEVEKTLRNFENTGISLLETSHRSSTYLKFNKDAQDIVRRLLDVPSNYKILFMAGGGQGQFAAVPLNLISRTGTADYVVTGDWSKKAAAEAKKYGKVNLVLPETNNYREIPDESTWKLDSNASYVYICTNETINGVEFDNTPDMKGVPLVADMSSNIMTRKFDVSKYGVIFAGAQKNIGTAGVTLVIVRDDLLDSALPITPSILDWSIMAKNDSVYNTPPMNSIYIMYEVLKWIERNGGLKEMNHQADLKSKYLYDLMDKSNGFYMCPVNKNRSRMNVLFRIGSATGIDSLEKEFLKGAEALNLIQLKGHRTVGGLRVSLYNAVSYSDVVALVDYMQTFQKQHSK